MDIDAYAPVVGCAGDDEFEGNSLNTTRWNTVVRRNDEFLSVEDGALHIDAQRQDMHGGETGLPNIVLQDLPASGPWTATTRVTWNPTVNYQNAGLMIYQSDANLIKTGMVWSGGRKFEAFKELNNSASGLGATANMPASFPSTFYLRLVSTDGQSVQPQYSPDGVTWTNTEHRHEHDRAGGREGRRVRHGVHGGGIDRHPGLVRLVPAHRAAGAERRVRRRRAEHVPVERDRAP